MYMCEVVENLSVYMQEHSGIRITYNTNLNRRLWHHYQHLPP